MKPRRSSADSRPNLLLQSGLSPNAPESQGVGPAQSPTSTLEDVAAAALEPGHVLEAEQGGVHPQARAALPHAVHVAGAHLGHQGH